MGFKLKCVEWVTGKHVNREHMNKRRRSTRKSIEWVTVSKETYTSVKRELHA